MKSKGLHSVKCQDVSLQWVVYLSFLYLHCFRSDKNMLYVIVLETYCCIKRIYQGFFRPDEPKLNNPFSQKKRRSYKEKQGILRPNLQGQRIQSMIECEIGKEWMNGVAGKGRWKRTNKWNYLATHWQGSVYKYAFN